MKMAALFVVLCVCVFVVPLRAQVNPRDLSGVWQLAPGGGGQGPGDNLPPLTAWGQAKYDGNKPGYGPKAAPGGNDPILKCDPMGLPRILFIIWPFEIIHIPGRILMFFEGHHTIREIWMDGRKFPDDPDPRWYGYSVGKWEGDTLVVETIGFNDKTWLGAQGQPHSDQMRTIERYRHVDHITIQLNMTVHAQIYLDVKDKNGNVVHWGIETNSPGILSRAGWTKRSLKAGDEVTIILCPAKNGEPVAYIGSGDPGTKVIFADGRELDFKDRTAP